MEGTVGKIACDNIADNTCTEQITEAQVFMGINNSHAEEETERVCPITNHPQQCYRALVSQTSAKVSDESKEDLIYAVSRLELARK